MKVNKHLMGLQEQTGPEQWGGGRAKGSQEQRKQRGGEATGKVLTPFGATPPELACGFCWRGSASTLRCRLKTAPLGQMRDWSTSPWLWRGTCWEAGAETCSAAAYAPCLDAPPAGTDTTWLNHNMWTRSNCKHRLLSYLFLIAMSFLFWLIFPTLCPTMRTYLNP